MENSVCMIGMFMSYSIFENMTVGLEILILVLSKKEKKLFPEGKIYIPVLGHSLIFIFFQWKYLT